MTETTTTVSVNEAAAVLDCSAGHVRRLVRDGKITAVRRGRDTRLGLAEVEAVLERAAQAEAPPVRGEAERNALAVQWQGLVVRVLRDLYGLRPVRRYYDECRSAGLVALVHACSSWREDGTAPLPVFLYHAIRNAILNEIDRAQHHLPHECSLGRWALAVPARDDPPAPDYGHVHAAVADLPDRERSVVARVYGLDGRPPRMQRQVAEELGVSAARVWQLMDRALARLHLALRPPK